MGRIGGIDLAWSAVFCLMWQLSAQAADLKSEFLARYEPAAKALEEAYSKVTIRAVCRRVGWAAYEQTGGKRTTFGDSQARGRGATG